MMMRLRSRGPPTKAREMPPRTSRLPAEPEERQSAAADCRHIRERECLAAVGTGIAVLPEAAWKGHPGLVAAFLSATA